MNKYLIGFFIISNILISSQTIFGQQITATFSKNIVKETNQFRKSNGLPALISRNDLDVLAQKHTTDMARGKVVFGHDGFKERTQIAKKELKETMGSFAENVAYGPKSATEVVKGWEDS